jgi:hypothetical protein
MNYKMDLKNIFTYHAPTPDQLPKYQALREAALTFAEVIETTVPDGADKSAAIRHVREAVMTANAAIALGGKL